MVIVYAVWQSFKPSRKLPIGKLHAAVTVDSKLLNVSILVRSALSMLNAHRPPLTASRPLLANP